MFIADMSAFYSLFRTKKLRPAWEFNARALIWHMFFTTMNSIVGEARDQSRKSTSFFCIDAKSGKPLWRDVAFDEPWWIGVETVNENRLILHGYTRPDMPEHRGIRLVDLRSGRMLWKNDDLTYWFIDLERLFAYKYLFEKRIGYELEINSGEVLLEYSDNLDVLHQRRQNVLSRDSVEQEKVIAPAVVGGEETDPAVDAAIRQITNGNTVAGQIEYYVRQGILLTSYYTPEHLDQTSSLKNILIVFDMGKEKVLFSDTIVRGVSVPSPDTFFLKDEFVYFVRDHSFLVALNPWK